MNSITVKSTKFGIQQINLDEFDPSMASPSSAIFKEIEAMFDKWFEHSTAPGAPMGRDILGMYNGEGDQPAIYSRRGAIIQGIETFIELAQDAAKPVITTQDILAMDIETAFE